MGLRGRDATAKGFGQEDWARQFAAEMSRLGDKTKPDKLIDIGRRLWVTMGDMRAEDVAKFEHASLGRDDC